jgi:hypothetical protein
MNHDLQAAIADVKAGHAERICSPGEWVVWREGDVVMSKLLGTAPAN